MELERFLNRLFLFLAVAVLGLGWLVWSPRTLAQFEGSQRLTAPLSADECKHYVHSIKESLRGGNAVKLSEQGINQYLQSALQMEQTRPLKPWVTVHGVFVDLSPAQMQVCLEREVIGRLNHCALSIQVDSNPKGNNRLQTHFTPTSGMFGKLKLPSRLGNALSPWYDSFVSSLSPTLKDLQPYVGKVELRENEVILTPPQVL